MIRAIIILAVMLALAACGGNGDVGRTPAGQATTPPSSAGATPDPAESSILIVELAASPTPTVRPPDATSAETDREALVALYNATGGESWERRCGWLSDKPIGEWEGVTIDQDGLVRKLDLDRNGLIGEIPPELGNLSNLEWLELDRNRLSGEIPPELGNLANLRGLYLYSNRLIGEIPPELGNLGKLKRLRLHRNDLSGEIPPELGYLPNLEQLELSRNQLSGEIPWELGKSTSLEYLALDSNRLSGEIPPELGYLAGSLIRLLLDGNQLSGCVPQSLEEYRESRGEINLPLCGE